jgi:hypothetical protein
VAFDQLSGVKPIGLIDGATNFFSDGTMLIGEPNEIIGAWQGATFSGLAPGTYTYTYIPIANPTVVWQPKDGVILSSSVLLTGIIIGGSFGNDGGIMATESAISVTEAQTGDLRQVARANASARHNASEGVSSMAMSQNGPSTADISAWARMGGGFVSADFNGHLDVSHFLGQAGIEVGVSSNFAVGVSVGGALSSAETKDEDLDGDAIFVQPYVAFTDDALTVIASLSYTHTDYDDSTDIINSGDRYSGSLSVAYDVPIDDETIATPFGFIAGGMEDLDVAGSDDDLNFVIGRVGVELSHKIDLLNTGTMHVFAAVAGEYVSANEPELSVASLLVDYDDSRFGGFVETGFDFTIAGTDTHFFASIIGSGLFSDAPGAGGKFGLTIPF